MRGPALLWVTRSSPFNLLTAQRLRAMGHGVFLAPLFDICPIKAPAIESRPDLIAFTSVNGVRHHPYRSDWSAVPVFVVGDTTAAAARRCGYLDVRSAGGDLGDLQALILRSVPTGMRLIHFSAAEPAGDLVAYLRCRGFDATRTSVYETVSRSLQEIQPVLVGEPRVDGIVVHSPKSSRRAAELVAETGWRGAVFCISAACAAEFRSIPGLRAKIAARPTERALMALIRQTTAMPTAKVPGIRLRGVEFVSSLSRGSYRGTANDNADLTPTPA